MIVSPSPSAFAAPYLELYTEKPRTPPNRPEFSLQQCQLSANAKEKRSKKTRLTLSTSYILRVSKTFSIFGRFVGQLDYARTLALAPILTFV